VSSIKFFIKIYNKSTIFVEYANSDSSLDKSSRQSRKVSEKRKSVDEDKAEDKDKVEDKADHGKQ